METHREGPIGDHDKIAQNKEGISENLDKKRKERKRRRLRRLRLLFSPPTAIQKISCPNQRCRRPVLLQCPYCLGGNMHCDEENYILICNNCHASTKKLDCGCGFPIKASYILERQKQHRQLSTKADGGAIKAAFAMMSAFALLVWAILAV